MLSNLTRKYWIDILLGWAEDRLPPPQLDECRAALDFAGLVERAVKSERQACAADVCPRCAAGDERETNGSGWFHRQPDKFAGHLYSACPAAPIHARGKGE